MKIPEIQESLEVYESTFQQFVAGYQLPAEWFRSADHLAIKCADDIDYLATCDTFYGDTTDGVWEIEVDGRSLGSAQLAGGIAIAGYNFGWLEIMQPRPGMESAEGFVEHTEFTVTDFYEVLRILEMRGVEGVDEQRNEGHAWINVPIDGDREIKFNDKPLAEVVAKERAEGKIHRVIANGH